MMWIDDAHAISNWIIHRYTLGWRVFQNSELYWMFRAHYGALVPTWMTNPVDMKPGEKA